MISFSLKTSPISHFPGLFAFRCAPPCVVLQRTSFKDSPIVHRTFQTGKADGSSPMLAGMAATQLQLSSFRAGDTVLTRYGAGVIVEVVPVPEVSGDILCSSLDHRYMVRLWRVPNRSVGSSSLASLQSSAVCLTHVSCSTTCFMHLVILVVFAHSLYLSTYYY